MEETDKLKALEVEEQNKRVREKLNRDKVKLWEPPHTNEDGTRGSIPNELIDKYSVELEMTTDQISEVLERLRLHSIEKLAARMKFQKTGVATLKVKLAGCVPEEAKQYSKGAGMALETSLTLSGIDFKNVICGKTGVEVLRLKVISGGRVLDDDQSLQQQGVKNQASVMALCLTDSEVAARQKQDMAARVSKTREAAQLLSSKDDEEGDNPYSLQIADQSGKKLSIPAAERKALVFAMTLHEKARSSIRRREYGEALLLLLEADGEFKHCNSALLTGVDNYALVCLDIVWCYLCLKSLRDLPDADERLRKCDECLAHSYGPNLERLATVKGETGIERALFMRLHLLQAIVAFHQGQTGLVGQLLDRVEREIEELRVDDNALTEVVAMGYSPLQARLALRACDGNTQRAVMHIIKKKEDRKQRLDKEMEERKRSKLQKKLGRTADGRMVNMNKYGQLISLGFPKGAAAEALRQCNNNFDVALEALQDNPDLLNFPDPDPEKPKITDELIAQVTMMGFSTEAARVALYKFSGQVERVVEELLKVQGEVPEEWKAAAEAEASTSSDQASSSSEGSTPEEDRERAREAYEQIAPDIADDEEAHLDFTLEEETAFLTEYRSLLDSMQ